MLNKFSALSVLLLTATTSFSALAVVDSQSTTNNVDNKSVQNSTGIVTNSPTYQTAIGETPYNRIGNISCAAPSVYGAVSSSGENYFDQGAATIGFSIPLLGGTCKQAEKEKLAQIRLDTHLTLIEKCKSMLEDGYAFTSANFSAKCQGFERTEFGEKIMEVRTAEVRAASAEATNRELMAYQQRMQICQNYARDGVFPAACKGIPLGNAFGK